jgi:nicotinamidase-related amidase
MSTYTAPLWSSSALITIDTQQDTLDGQSLEIPGTSAVLPNMRRLLLAYRGHGLPIVHVVRLYKSDGSNVDLCRREAVENGARMLLSGSPGSELAPPLLPHRGGRLDASLLLAGGVQTLSEHEVVIYKPRWGAFYKTRLEAHLRERNVSTLVFCGCNFPNCPRASIYEASERDFRVVLVEDAVSGLYDRGRDEMAKIEVAGMRTDEVVIALSDIEVAGDVHREGRGTDNLTDR